MKLRVVAQDGNSPERFEFFIELDENRSATFGKLNTDVLVPDNKFISRAHFEVYREGNRLFVRHLSKRNPTRIFFPPRKVINVLDFSGAVSEVPPGACILAGRYVFRLFGTSPDSAREDNNRSSSLAVDNNLQTRNSEPIVSSSQPVLFRPDSDLSVPEFSSISSETQGDNSELTAYKANSQISFLTDGDEEREESGSTPSVGQQIQRGDKFEHPTVGMLNTSLPPVRSPPERFNPEEINRLVQEPTSIREESIEQPPEQAVPTGGFDRSQTKSVPSVSERAAVPPQSVFVDPLEDQPPETFQPESPGRTAVPRNTVSYATLWEFSASSHWAVAMAVSEVEVLMAAQPGIPQTQPALNQSNPSAGRREEAHPSPAKVAAEREDAWQVDSGGSKHAVVDSGGQEVALGLGPADESPSDQIPSRHAVQDAQPPYVAQRAAESERSQAGNLPSYDESHSRAFRVPRPMKNDFSREETEKSDSLPVSLVQPRDSYLISNSGEDEAVEFESDFFEAEDDDRSDPEIFHDSIQD